MIRSETRHMLDNVPPPPIPNIVMLCGYLSKGFLYYLFSDNFSLSSLSLSLSLSIKVLLLGFIFLEETHSGKQAYMVFVYKLFKSKDRQEE